MKRIRVRNISWKDYGISVQTQRELKEFCFLYDEKKKRGNSQDLTDCKMIEEAARESSEELAPYLLKSVTDDLSYEYLEFDDTLGRIPVGKTDFYGYRRKFYACLLKKIGDKSGTARTYVRYTITSNDTDTGQREREKDI